MAKGHAGGLSREEYESRGHAPGVNPVHYIDRVHEGRLCLPGQGVRREGAGPRRLLDHVPERPRDGGRGRGREEGCVLSSRRERENKNKCSCQRNDIAYANLTARESRFICLKSTYVR